MLQPLHLAEAMKFVTVRMELVVLCRQEKQNGEVLKTTCHSSVVALSIP
jgi:hypothetical protein